MNDLPWFGAFTGTSTDKLLSYEGRFRIDSLVAALEERLQERADAESFAALSQVERDVLAVCALEREVNNGGYHQLFVNASARALEAVDALRRIGCPLTAALTQEAIAALGRGPAPSSDEVLDALESDRSDALDEALEPFDLRFYEYPEEIAERLFAYVKAHRGEVRLAIGH